MKQETSRPSGLASGFASLVGFAAPLAVYLVTTPFIISRLGVAQYGVLALCLSLTSFLGSLDFGLGAGGLRALGSAVQEKRHEDVVRLHRELFSFFLYLGLAVASAVWWFAADLARVLEVDRTIPPDEARFSLRIAAVSLLVAFLIAALSILPRALEQIPRLVVVQVLAGVGLWGGAALLLHAGGDLTTLLVWALAISGIVCVALALWNVRLANGLIWWPCTNLSRLSSHVGYSMFAFLAQLSSAFTYNADKFLIAYFLGPAPVAFYAVAVNIASQLLSLVAVLTAFVFPRAVTLHASGDGESMRELYLRGSRYTWLVLVPIVAPATLLAHDLLTLWLGSAFADTAAPVLQLLLVAYFVASLSVVASHVYNGMGNSRIGAMFAVCGGLVNVGLCFVLIPAMGVTGAAMASLVGMLQAIIFWGCVEKDLGFGWFRAQPAFVARLLLVGTVQFAVLYYASGLVAAWSSLFAAGGLALGLFYGLWFILGFANEEDYGLLKRLACTWRR